MGALRAGANPRKDAPNNVVGPQVRRLRLQQGLSQPQLVIRCQLKGYDLSREGLSKVEARLRLVTDAEVLLLAEALGVPAALLFPPPGEVAAILGPFRAGREAE